MAGVESRQCSEADVTNTQQGIPREFLGNQEGIPLSSLQQ